MTFLPIVQRELIESSRRPRTWIIRWGAAAVAIGFAAFIFTSSSGYTSPGQLGGNLFSVLVTYAFLLCMAAGPFLTSDSLSREKREGTLGLLLLTDLTGYDVVLGKFLAGGLNAIFCLFAILPVLAIPLLLGGVAMMVYIKVAVALVAALLLSLAAGLAASANGLMSMDGVRIAVVGLMIFCFGAVLPEPICLGPVRAVYEAFDGSAVAYWVSISSTIAGTVYCLVHASRKLPDAYRETGVSGPQSVSEVELATIRASLRMTRSDVPRRIGQDHPVCWYLSRLSSGRHLVLPMTILVCALAFFGLASEGVREISPVIVFLNMFGFFLLKFYVAADACRFFANARHDGAMEILQTTPLTLPLMIEGVSKALEQFYLKRLVISACVLMALGFGLFV